MMTNLNHDLLKLCDLYAQHMGISHWRVSFLVRKDGQFFKRLKDGKSCTTKTAYYALDRFATIWPADLEWPRQIPRPKPTKKTVAA